MAVKNMVQLHEREGGRGRGRGEGVSPYGARERVHISITMYTNIICVTVCLCVPACN